MFDFSTEGGTQEVENSSFQTYYLSSDFLPLPTNAIFSDTIKFRKFPRIIDLYRKSAHLSTMSAVKNRRIVPSRRRMRHGVGLAHRRNMSHRWHRSSCGYGCGHRSSGDGRREGRQRRRVVRRRGCEGGGRPVRRRGSIRRSASVGRQASVGGAAGDGRVQDVLGAGRRRRRPPQAGAGAGAGHGRERRLGRLRWGKGLRWLEGRHALGRVSCKTSNRSAPNIPLFLIPISRYTLTARGPDTSSKLK